MLKITSFINQYTKKEQFQLLENNYVVISNIEPKRLKKYLEYFIPSDDPLNDSERIKKFLQYNNL